MNFLKTNLILCDAPQPWQIGFQEPCTPVMEGIINFHHDLMFFLVMICVFVFYLLTRCVFLYGVFKEKVHSKLLNQNILSRKSNSDLKSTNFTHNTKLEIIWTVIPTLILLVIVFPSLALLFATEDFIQKPYSTYHIIGHQWYWTYEYKDTHLYTDKNVHLKFDSYMLPTSQLPKGGLRTLEVDNTFFVPVKVPLRLLVSSADVIHSWALPSAGIKIDACPGRLNQIFVTFKRTGKFYGQCSEICGINHAFMPIVVEVLEDIDYLNELKNRIEEM